MADWTFTVDDTSPMIIFHPHGDGGSGNQTNTGWQPWYSVSGFNTVPANGGVGESLHITGFPGANLTLQFYGKDVTLYGMANCSYDVILDQTTQSFDPTNGTLFQSGTVSEQMHEITLVPHPTDGNMFAFDRADITRSHLPQDGESGPRVTVYQVASNSSAEFFTFSGDWAVKTASNIPNASHPQPFYQVDGPTQASVTFSFQGTGVALNGTRDWGGWTYSVDLDDNVANYNGSTQWFIGDTLLFYQDGLDANKTHTLKLTPTTGTNIQFRLSTVTILNAQNSTSGNGTSTNGTSTNGTSTNGTSTNGTNTSDNGHGGDNSGNTSTPHGSHTGTIVGAVVGVIAGLAIIAAILIVMRRRSARRTRTKRDRMQPFLEASPSPSPPPMSQLDSTDATTPRSPEARTSPPRITPSSKLAAERAYAASRAANAAASTSHPAGPPGSQASSQGVTSTTGTIGVTSPGGAQSASEGGQATPSQYSSSSPGTTSGESSAAVDRLIQLIVERIDRTPPQASGSGGHRSARSDFGGSDMAPDHPPPSYVA